MALFPYTISKWVGHRDTLMIERVYEHISQDFSADEMAKVRVVGGAEKQWTGMGEGRTAMDVLNA